MHPVESHAVHGGVQIRPDTHLPVESNVNPDAQEMHFVAEVQTKQSVGQTLQIPFKYYPVMQHVPVHGSHLYIPINGNGTVDGF